VASRYADRASCFSELSRPASTFLETPIAWPGFSRIVGLLSGASTALPPGCLNAEAEQRCSLPLRTHHSDGVPTGKPERVPGIHDQAKRMAVRSRKLVGEKTLYGDI
jgi:hypothetical protein